MILDWDVHFGNGTMKAFSSDPRVLYISIHRYQNAKFFPCSEDGSHKVVGSEGGAGFTINVPWNKVSPTHNYFAPKNYLYIISHTSFYIFFFLYRAVWVMQSTYQ